MKISQLLTPLILCLAIVITAGCLSGAPRQNVSTPTPVEAFRTVVDSRGISVKVPTDIHRVVTIDDGLILEVMTVLNEEEKLVGVGSRTYQEIDTYTFTTVKGPDYTFTGGMNTMTYLHPWVRTLPVIAEFEGGVNYEAIVALQPDVVIIELGSCTFWTNDENVKKATERIESLGLPLVVLKGTDFFEEPDIAHLWDEVRIIGQVFGKEKEAQELNDYLKSQVDLIQSRTQNISEKDRPSVLYFGLGYVARDEGGAGNTVSLKSFESWAIEHLVNAKNAFREETGYWHVISAERVLALNPDVIILPTDWGYHPVREIYEAPYYQNLREVAAIKNRRVASMPYTPYDCAKRLEYPIEVMAIAKTTYPERFKDISLADWVPNFYVTVYGVNQTTAEGIISAQWMDWIINNQT